MTPPRASAASAAWRWLLAHPGASLAAFMILISVYRLSLVDRGHFYWGDELRFLRAHDAISDLAGGHPRAAVARQFEALGRPGFVLWSLAPAAVQRVWCAFAGADWRNLDSFDTACVFNVLVSAAVSLLVYSIAARWLSSRWHAVVAAVVHALLAVSNVWIRHFVPYEMSLAWSLLGLRLLLAGVQGERADLRVMAGAASALSFVTYPGHYAFVMINGAMAVATARRRVRSVAGFALGGLSVAVLFEAAARWSGARWLAAFGEFSPTMGLFSEGFVFAWRYMVTAEGVVGAPLLVLAIVVMLHAAGQRLQAVRSLGSTTQVADAVPDDGTNRTSFQWVILAAAACYLAHAAMGVVFQKSVFYGRVWLMYVPLVVIAAVASVATLRRAAFRRLGLGALVAAAVVSFGGFALPYAKLSYPNDMWNAAMIARGGNPIRAVDEFYGSRDGSPAGVLPWNHSDVAMVADTIPEGIDAYIHLDAHAEAASRRPELVGVNLRYMFYVAQRWDRFEPPEGYASLATAPHPHSFPAMLFEGFRPCERDRVRTRGYQMKVLALEDQRGDASTGLVAGR